MSSHHRRQLIAERFGWFLETYDGYHYDIQRVDAARYFILYEFGGTSWCDMTPPLRLTNPIASKGVYADVDYELLAEAADWSAIVDGAEVTLMARPPDDDGTNDGGGGGAGAGGGAVSVTNALMAAVPRSPFLRAVCVEMASRAPLLSENEIEALSSR